MGDRRDGHQRLDDATAKKRTFKSFMYLEADVKILDAIEDLKFVVNMA